jgi:hypothetical protein
MFQLDWSREIHGKGAMSADTLRGIAAVVLLAIVFFSSTAAFGAVPGVF